MYANAKNSLVASLLLALLLSAITVPACGPFYDYAVFVNTLHPDFPFEPFAAGNLGVVQPSWAYSYLVVAYRYLDGKPFSPDDQATLIRFWTDRLACSNWGQDPSVKEWLAARGQVPGASNPPERFEVFKPFGGGGISPSRTVYTLHFAPPPKPWRKGSNGSGSTAPK